MKMSAGVEWSLHCCTALSTSARPVPVTKLAELHGVSQTYLAKHMQALSRAGLIHAVEGRDGGYLLSRPGAEISVYDVVQAVDGPEPAFRCTEIRQQGPLPATGEACKVPCGIAKVMAAAETAWRDSLQAVTLADLAATLDSTSPGAWDAVRHWLSGTRFDAP
ncbi:DNA-binding protein [Nocardioides sp. CF8]|uniref:RrF2 family transcriptional regulator n=1 Tax=Nocardioides sp. CF8 TaxID=110319 RepID=UPI00032FDB14|nr:Rrf2 family transcriptional regulator [Nocardioides sp. CF8]EON22615.1 DNA-binding protein [Nocardioides sp. CF8]